jgi:hypothetical protein
MAVTTRFHFFHLGGTAFPGRFSTYSDVLSTNVSPLILAPQVAGISLAHKGVLLDLIADPELT